MILHSFGKAWDQALTNPTIPTVDELSNRLVRVSLPSDHVQTAPESYALVSDYSDCGGGGRGRGHGQGRFFSLLNARLVMLLNPPYILSQRLNWQLFFLTVSTRSIYNWRQLSRPPPQPLLLNMVILSLSFSLYTYWMGFVLWWFGAFDW